MTKELRAKAKQIKATIWLGKEGLEKTHLAEIKKQLKMRKLVKVKLQKSLMESVDRKTFAKELAKHTDSELIDVVGGVIVLHKDG